MRDYMVKSKVEVYFTNEMQTDARDVFDAEARVKEIIRMAVNCQLNNYKKDNSKILVDIKCSTIDLGESKIVHQDS